MDYKTSLAPPLAGGWVWMNFDFWVNSSFQNAFVFFFFQVGGGGVSCLCTEIIDVAIQIKGL